MNLEKLKNAVEMVKDILRCTQDMGHDEDRESMQCLIDLAERVLAVELKLEIR